jgi:hypothetical protein
MAEKARTQKRNAKLKKLAKKINTLNGWMIFEYGSETWGHNHDDSQESSYLVRLENGQPVEVLLIYRSDNSLLKYSKNYTTIKERIDHEYQTIGELCHIARTVGSIYCADLAGTRFEEEDNFGNLPSYSQDFQHVMPLLKKLEAHLRNK